MSIKIAAVADLHLGRKSTQVSSLSVDSSTKGVLNRIEEYCKNEDVDILLLLGDIIDRENKYFEAYNPLTRTLTELADNDISIYAVAGNHDYDTFPEIINVIKNKNINLIGEKGIWESKIYNKDNNKIQFVGWSFPTQYYTTSPVDRLEPEIIENDIPTIGMVHGDLFDKNSHYAPLDRGQLTTLSINAWMLGHIHKREKVNQSPLVVYPGSPQALDPGEKDGHGIALFSAEEGEIRFERFENLSSVLYKDIVIKISIDVEVSDLRPHIMNKVLTKIKNLREKNHDRFLVLDIIFEGFNADMETIKTIKEGLQSDHTFTDENAKIRKVEIGKLRPLEKNLDDISESGNVIGALASMMQSLKSEGDLSDTAREVLNEVSSQNDNLSNNRTYREVLSKEDNDKLNMGQLKELILDEANIILSHFTQQQLSKERND